MKNTLINLVLLLMLFGTNSSCTKDKGNTVTQAMFYAEQDCGVGYIYVTVNGTTQSITRVYALAPSCGQTGIATFNLDAGTYNYTAISQNQTTTWSGTITVRPNSCNSFSMVCGGVNNGANGCSSYSLNGTWVRQNDGTVPGTTGMVVFYSGNEGVIQSVPTNANCFVAGEVKWQNYNSGSCIIDDLESSCSSANYNSYSVSFTDINTVTVGNIVYKRQ